MRMLLICMLFSRLFAQDLINQIIEGNPFDPERGNKAPITEVEGPGEFIPADLPVCDGTLILGELKLALLTFRIEGQPAFKYLKIGEETNGYKLSEVNYDNVVLNQGGRIHTITLFQQESKKERRGGSRKAAKRAIPKKGKKPVGKKADSKKKKSNKSKPRKDNSKVQKKKQPKIIKKTTKKPTKTLNKPNF